MTYTVLPGSATFPEDYNDSLAPLTGTLTFAAGETTRQITLDITDDLIPERTETFTVGLSAPTNAEITKAVGTGTIVDSDPGIVWVSSDNSLANITINGSLSVGTNISAGILSDHWTNGTGDQLWSTDGNWEDGTQPVSTDRLVFDEIDSYGTNIVDIDFLIDSLHYTGAGAHTTDLISSSNLDINGDATIGVANTDVTGSLNITNVGVTLNGTDINVGINTMVSGSVAGNLFLGSGAYIDAENASVLSIGRVIHTSVGYRAQADGELTLGSASTLVVGTATAPAVMNIGRTESTYGYVASNVSVALGLLDATDGVLDAQLSELNVGRTAGMGTANGQFIMGESASVSATTVNIGVGWGATGELSFLHNLTAEEVNVGFGPNTTGRLTFGDLFEVNTINVGLGDGATGTLTATADDLSFVGLDTSLNFGTGVLDVTGVSSFTLGSAGDALSNLRIGYNTVTTGTATTAVDFNLMGNPVFTAHIGEELSVGRVIHTSVGYRAQADGELTLGSASTLVVGTATAPAVMNIGRTESVYGTTTSNVSVALGLLDATEGVLDAQLSELNVGRTAGMGTANGQFIMGDGSTIDVGTVNVGVGTGASGIFDFLGGTLSVDIFNGTLDQDGGRLDFGGSAGITTIIGDYNLASIGTLGIELDGASVAGVDYNQLDVNGAVNLNADTGTGGMLDLLLGFTPTVGDTFTILDNDKTDLIVGSFEGLADNALFDVVSGTDTVTFRIDYDGGDGNDVVLTTTNVATAAPLVAMSVVDSTAVVEQDLQTTQITSSDWLTGGAGDEPLVFEQVAAKTSTVELDPVSTLGIVVTETTIVDSNLVDTAADLTSLDVGLVDDSQLIGLSVDVLGFSEGNV